MEEVTLTTPEVTPEVTTTGYRVVSLLLAWARAEIVIHLRGTNGERREVRYEGTTATALMTALNTADLSSNSLQRRILARLVADGHLTGTVTGIPD